MCLLTEAGGGAPALIIHADYLTLKYHYDIWETMACTHIDELRDHLNCEIEIDEYSDGHLTVECKTCNKILLHIYPLILPQKLKGTKNALKNYHISGQRK